MAFRRGDDSELAYLGAMMTADHMGMVNMLVRNWHKIHSK